jgi:hypothetical protein
MGIHSLRSVGATKQVLDPYRNAGRLMATAGRCDDEQS